MNNDILFESLRRVYEMHSTAGSIDPESISIMVQRGKGDPTYSLGVACAFKAVSGAKWDKFCDIYDTSKKKTEEDERICRGELREFWNKIKRSGHYSEFISVAEWYLRIKDEFSSVA